VILVHVIWISGTIDEQHIEN